MQPSFGIPREWAPGVFTNTKLSGVPAPRMAGVCAHIPLYTSLHDLQYLKQSKWHMIDAGRY